jgi:hypothetical protein
VEGGGDLAERLDRVRPEALVAGGDRGIDHPRAPGHVPEVEQPDDQLLVDVVDHDIVVVDVAMDHLGGEIVEGGEHLGLEAAQRRRDGGPTLLGEMLDE